MWSYYNGHKGVCIGLDREKTKKCLSTITQSIYIGAQEMEVQYKEIIEKPDFFKGDYFDNFKYQLSTKAKEWAHEEEVRLLLIDPTPAVVKHHPSFAEMVLPQDGKYKNAKVVDWREWRAYPEIASDCFESVYLGVRINAKERDAVIEAAKKLNQRIKIYQMKIDPDAFRLKEELIS